MFTRLEIYNQQKKKLENAQINLSKTQFKSQVSLSKFCI